MPGAPRAGHLTNAYPGDGYVDYVGTDVYDEYWGTPQTPQNAWSYQLVTIMGTELAGELRGGPRQGHRLPGMVGVRPQRRARAR